MADIKNATTIDEQIELLKSRGMIIKDLDKAKENLLDIGYFRLGFYWFPFEKTYPRKTKRDHSFIENTYFDYAIKLYYFDFDLRNLFLRYISRVEINFRTKLIYFVSNKYKDNPFWYLDDKVLKEQLIKSNNFKKILNDIKVESVIRNDIKSHGRQNSPAWKAIEYMSFGATISIYDNLLDGKLKHDISVAFGMQSPNQFSNYINTVRRLRNYCAHGKVLYDLSLPVAIGNGPLGNLGVQKTKLAGVYRVLHFLLGKVSNNRANEMNKELLDAINVIDYPILKDIIYKNTAITPDVIEKL